MKSILRFLPCAASLGLLLTSSAGLAQDSTAANFEAVSKHIETGGVFYGLVDLEGDAALVAGLGDAILNLARKEAGGAIPPGLSAAGIIKALGFDRLKAIGMSSKKTGGLFQNRALIYMPEGRTGLFKLFGGPAAPLQSPLSAPAGSDLVLESELTLSALLEVAESVLRSTGDPQLLQQFKGVLGYPVPVLNMTAGDFIARLNTRIIVAGRLEKGKTFSLPDGQSLPAFRLVVSFDQLDFLFPALMEYLKQSDKVKIETGEGFERIQPTEKAPEGLEGLLPVIHHDLKSKRIVIGTHPDAVKEFLEAKAPLSGDPVFVKATAGLPKVGNEFSYATPALFAVFEKFIKTAMAESGTTTPGGPSPEIMEGLMKEFGKLSPWPDQAIAGVRANLPDGMFYHSTSTNSYKSILPLAATLPIALVSGAAFGAYGKVMPGIRAKQAASEAAEEADHGDAPEEGEEAKAVRNNLQQISFAAQTWFLDHADAKEVSYEQLIEGELIFRLDAVKGESYKGLKVKKAGGTLTVKLSDGGSVTQKYGPVTD